ncbi:retrovirus-related pol polyprotein from transposon TNT 1-94, partial [Tanacetum coccineum]
SAEPTLSSRPTNVEVPTELPKVSIVNTSLKKLKHHLASFDVVVKERSTPTAITEGSWGFEHTKACFRDEIIPFVKALKDFFNTFDQYLIDELYEVQNVFHKMEQTVEQHRKFSNGNSVSNQSAPSFDQLFELNELKPQSQKKDTVIKKLKERIKTLSGKMYEDKIKKDLEEIETINIELDHRVSKLIAENEHLKQTYKQLYDSIKPTRIRSKEQCDDLINQVNLKSVEIFDLNASLQKKVLEITALKDDLRKLKGKALVNNVVTKHTIDPEMRKVDVEPITPKLLNKRTAHSAYIKHTQEEAAVLRDLVDHVKANYPLDHSLKSACRYTKLIQELLTNISKTCPSINNSGKQLVATTPKNKNKFRLTEPVTSSRNTITKTASTSNLVSNKPMLSSTGVKPSTSASGSQPSGNTKKDKNRQTPSSTQKNKVEAHPRKVESSLKNKDCVGKPKGTAYMQHSKINANYELKCGKVFTNIRYIWRPTGRTFTIVGNVCPLTRITTTTEVPLRKPTALENETPKPVVTLVYSRKPRKSKTNIPVRKSKVFKSVYANKKKPSQSWGSIVFDVPSSSLDECRRSKLFSGTVKFENDHVAKILGYGDYQIGNVTILRVYYVEGLGHKLFSVGQFYDSNLEVAFRQHTCFIRNLEGVDLLTGSRGNNLYTLSLGDMMTSSPICLLSKASKTKSWLWHRRFPKLKFEKDHLCSACAMGKSKKKPHKPKSEDTNQEKLYLLHMDLCGPMRVASVNGKKYILVIVDDYSRFTWVKCLRSKDEAPDFIIKFLKMIQVRLKVPVRRIRTDNGTEFVNQTLREYYEKVGISHETSVARSLQQNGVVERRNRTLIEAARTMLIYAKASLFLWAEAVATACYTQNRSIIRLRHGKTPYELLHDKPPDLSFFHVFGALCYPKNDSENLEESGKLDMVLEFWKFMAMVVVCGGSMVVKWCSACAMGKSKKKSHKPKSNDTNQEKLYLFHMDLCRPMRVASVNGKKYILVIVDDYSRFTWVKCLRSKDEAPDFIIKFLKMIQVRLKVPVRRIRTDNGTEFVNQTLPARTMLIYAKAPLFLWAEAVATACYTQNRSIIRLRHGKTPYELLHDKLPDLSFFHVFGALCYPTNDSENLDFDELTAMASEHSSSGPILHEMTPATISSGLVPNPPPSTPFVHLQELIRLFCFNHCLMNYSLLHQVLIAKPLKLLL